MNNTVTSECEFVSAALSQIAVQAGSIARGLENAAPTSSSSATASVQYLHAVASQFAMESSELLQMRVEPSAGQTYQNLLAIVQQIICQDKELRDKCHMGERFRFVSDRLHALLPVLEGGALAEKAAIKEKQSDEMSADAEGQPVYVYLYNAQGAILRTWAALLTPRAFYEYSVNRPVYRDKKDIEEMIAQKSNRVQHAYLTVLVDSDVISDSGSGIRVKEGSLQIERLILFTHNNQEYFFKAGELIQKT